MIQMILLLVEFGDLRNKEVKIMYLVFNDNLEKKYSIKAFTEDGGLITIQYNDEIPSNNSGFIICDIDGITLLADFSNYTTKYNVTNIGNAVMYSCDGSVETEDNKLEVYYEDLSLDQIRESMLENLKVEKIADSKLQLSKFLENNPLVSSCHGNKKCSYSVTREKQSLMMSQYMTYQIEKQINPDAVLTWNASGEQREVWTEEEFLQLIIEVKQYVSPMIAYQQALEKQIEECNTITGFDAIVIDYTEFLQ